MVSSKNILKITSYVLLFLCAAFMLCTDIWAAASNSKPAMVNRIDFIAGEKGASTLIIGTTAEVQYDLQIEDGNKMRLVLENTVIPTYRRKALVTSTFDSAINRILPLQSTEGNEAYVLIDLKENVPYKMEKTSDGLKINFSATTVKPAATPEPLAQENLTVTMPKAPSAMGSSNRISGTITAPQASNRNPTEIVDTTISYATSRKSYSGTPIALDFYETDIRNVIRILQEVSGRNFAVDRDVTGMVTLSFKRPVPWDQVLDLVLTMNQLSYIDDGDIIRVSNTRTLTREAEERTTALNRSKALQDAETQSTAFIPVYYAKATDLLSSHITPWIDEVRDSISNNTGDSKLSSEIMATADSRLNMLVINAPERIIEQVRAMVQNLDKVTPQVLIEARIIEANSSFTRELGVDWGTISIGAFDFLGGDLSLDLASNNIPTSMSSQGGTLGFSFSKIGGTSFEIMNAKISAAEQEGLTNILSAPRILTLNTETAMIKQGLQVPYLERDDAGGSSVQFKDADLLLQVTPNITLDNRVTLEVLITKNEVDQSSTGDEPSLITNEARTKFMVDDGDTVVIGGILKSSRSNTENGIPGLKNLSLLGWLFRSERLVESKNELLIFMTPKIITLDSRNNLL